ncbi:hypothetical protein V498_08065 [Pseudogymnoascus sp. VKM F-4517 (FW-2822)]|nr:hypothetical protein V498_08065 [Pseudogymnoascus sp. VKM F-4517 (FW-2822)]
MDAACNVVYVDRGARQERLVRRGEVLTEVARSGGDADADEGARRLQVNVHTLLGTFNKVYVCPTGLSCLARIARLNSGPTADRVPTLALIDIPEDDDDNERKVPVPVPIEEDEPLQEGENDAGEVSSARTVGEEPGVPNLYGSHLIRQITTDTKQQGVANIVLSVAVARRSVEIPSSTPSTPTPTSRYSASNQPPSPAAMRLPPNQTSDMKYVDLGAVDVLDNPINRESLPSLAIHIYRVHKEFERRGRHLQAPTQKHESPWPGVPTPYPFPYLREVMVQDLAGQICGTIVDHPLDPVVIDIGEGDQRVITNAIGDWNFSAHDLDDNGLLFATVRMLEHALQMEGMEEWRLPTDELLNFVVASRNGYNDFVPYHNFRHVVDVLQAVFLLLVRIGALPPFPPGASIETEPKSKLVKLLRPFEALTLLIAAIGHDIGHPGVNNMFLVKSKAPLASLYNDKSVLESYHAAVYCQLLKRLWPAVVKNEEMKVLLTSCILSTDMGIHNQYMEKLEKLQESMQNLSDDDEIQNSDLVTYRHVACNLLIKCADISNVARPFLCASVWTAILTEEFARQASMEEKIQLIPSTLFAPPATEIISLGKSQTGFMSFYALPLFTGVADLMPTTDFCVKEIESNKREWEDRIRIEEARLRAIREQRAREEAAQQQARDREGSDDSVDSNNPPTAPAAESSATGAAAGTSSGGPSGSSGAASGGQSSSAPSGGQDSADVPPALVRGQQPQSSSRPNSSSVTWDEASANSRPVTSSSARRVLDTSQVVTHRRSETTDGSASVPESGGWEGSARTGDSGKSEEKAECISTARTSVESTGMRGVNGVNGVNGTKRKSLVNSVSTPDLRSDSKGRMMRGESGGRERDHHHRKKGDKGDGSGVFASMRELSRRPSLGKFKFWKKREAGGFGPKETQIPPMPNVMGRRGREGGVSAG